MAHSILTSVARVFPASLRQKGRTFLSPWLARERRLDDHFFPVHGCLFLQGSYRSIGRAYAAAAGHQISTTLARARAYRDSLSERNRRDLDRWIHQLLDLITASIPAVREMMEGVYELTQSAASFEDLALANLSNMIGDWQGFHRSCSAFAVHSPAPILAQNLDLGMTNDVVLAYLLPEDGPARLMHANLGYLWFSSGINEFGLCFGGASTNVARGIAMDNPALPTPFLDFLLQETCHSSTDIATCLNRNRPFGPDNEGITLVALDPLGALLSLEITGSDVFAEAVSSRSAIAVNHFVQEKMRHLNDRSSSALLLQKNSEARASKASHFLGTHAPTAAETRRFLRDSSGPGAWCRMGRPEHQGWTTASYVIDLANATLDSWSGVRPRLTGDGWRRFDLSVLFARRPLA